MSASYSKDQVTSLDGTTIGFRRLGTGPAVIVVHGGMQASQYFMGLATALSDAFEVLVVDRRGRGLSGPHGDHFSIQREVEDLQAIVAASGATRIFGLSAGALVSLRTALSTPALTKVALYEPPLSVHGSAPVGWVPRYERELADGNVRGALITALKGLGTDRTMSRIPRFILAPLFRFAPVSGVDGPDDVPILDLVPTLHYDMLDIAEMADTADDYANLAADVLLLGGSKSPAFLDTSLDELERVLPHRRRVTLDGLDHSGPDDDGDPARVAVELRAFFAPDKTEIHDP